MKKLFALLALTFLVAACENAPDGFVAAPLDFQNKQPISINVAEVRVNEAYQSPMRAPYIEQDFPLPPAAAVKIWTKQRLYATGTSGVLEVTINDASVKQENLPRTKGVQGLFTEDQDARYTLSLNVSMRLFNGTDAMSSASGDVIITRSRTVSEKATVDDRMKVFDQMTKEAIATFDTQAQSRLKQYFAAYLR